MRRRTECVHPVGVSLEPCDTIVFEIVDRAAAEHLSHRLRSCWPGWLEPRDHLWLVTAELRPVEGDLALLFREVEAWVAEGGLREIWFYLDGRSYLLDAGKVDAAASVA
jgi:hypothetical protein